VGRRDFSDAHAVLRRHCEAHRLSGVSTLVFEDGVVVDDFCFGEADTEQRRALRPDHIHRSSRP